MNALRASSSDAQRDAAFNAAREYLAAPEQSEPIMYQYRWTNPADNPNTSEDEFAWRLVVPKNVHTDTVEDKVRELRGYRYHGKVMYEVRALYTHPLQPTELSSLELAVIGREHFGNPIPKEWYAAARSIFAAQRSKT
jgi:hypothetical protein